MFADLAPLFTAAFVTFFVLLDAVGVAPVFATMTAHGHGGYRQRMAVQSIVVATAIILGFAFGGAWLLEHLGISLHAFRIAGGALLFLIALDMVFERRTAQREKRSADYQAEGPDHAPLEDISVFPVGIPMLAGPGIIASVMLYMSEHPSWLDRGAVFAALGLNMLLALAILLAAGPLVRLFGKSTTGALTRILGVLLTALAIQFIIDGITGAFGLVV
ncbi:MAG: MarC family protein [Maricaulaceae bacterium]|jgi:multiple antibiotic resistance protein